MSRPSTSRNQEGKWMVLSYVSGGAAFHFVSDTKMKVYLSRVGYQILYGCSAFIDALEGEARDAHFQHGIGLVYIPSVFV